MNLDDVELDMLGSCKKVSSGLNFWLSSATTVYGNLNNNMITLFHLQLITFLSFSGHHLQG